MVGTKTLTNCLLIFLDISPLLSLVANPTAQLPFLGYSMKTTFLNACRFGLEREDVICFIVL